MKHLKSILIFSLLVFTKSMFSQQTRKVLFLGNSYTYVNNLPQIVSELATSTGDVLIYDSNLIGGYTLLDHSTNTISQNKILSNDWDYIVLQEQSQTPAFSVPLAFLNGFGVINSFINQNKPCAQITSFMTWGHQNGDTQNCPNNPSVCTYDSMQNLITARYIEFSDIFESEVTPVGVVWKYIRENYPSINLYQSDGSHPSLAGSYLAACCFYTSIFRKDPTLIANNYGLDANTAAIIRAATKSLVFNIRLSCVCICKFKSELLSLISSTNCPEPLLNFPPWRMTYIFTYILCAWFFPLKQRSRLETRCITLVRRCNLNGTQAVISKGLVVLCVLCPSC